MYYILNDWFLSLKHISYGIFLLSMILDSYNKSLSFMRNNLRHFTDIINCRGTRAIAPLHVEYLIRWVAKHGTVFIPSPVVGLLWSPVGVCKYFSCGNPHPRSFMDDVGGSEVEGANACKDRNQTSHSTIDSCINRFCDWQSLFLALSFTYFNQNYSTHGIIKRYTKE